MTLDRIDIEILAGLQKNARLTNKELAAEVGLAPSSCHERVRRLQDAGILQGYHAQVDASRLGIQLEALVSVSLQRFGRSAVDEFRAHALTLREVVAVYYLAGAIDFMVHVVVRDTIHLRDLVLESFSDRPEVSHVETSLIFDHSRRWTLPNYLDVTA